MSHANYGENNGFYMKNHSEETLALLSVKAKNREKLFCDKCNKFMDISTFSKHYKSCGIIKEKIYKSSEDKEKVRQSKIDYMKTHNPMHLEINKIKIKESWSKKSEIICPHCSFKSKGIGVMYRFHFDNCKQNPDYKPKVKLIFSYPHCDVKSKSKSNMTRFHGDNCKNKLIDK